QNRTKISVGPDRPPIQQVGMLVDAQLTVLLASEPPPSAWARCGFRRTLAGLVSLGPPLRSVRYCNHEVLRFNEMAPDPAIAPPEPVAPGAEQYATLAELPSQRARSAEFFL